uniref:Uncharacterized protein n=2 Tax=Cacopsylla melanoneura TaxID=428564 RepID=A0A8D8YKF3_9HEMI
MFIVYSSKAKQNQEAKFVRFLFKKLNGFYPTYPSAISYTDLMEHLNIGTLSARRKFQKIILLYNIFNNNISVGDISNEMCIRVPIVRLRTRDTASYFYINNSLCAPVSLSSPVISAMILYNQHSSQLDLAWNISTFKIIGREILELEQPTDFH